MKVNGVISLKEVADDLNGGKAFYDQREVGVGDYFWDSLIADIESLIIYAGVHSNSLFNLKISRFQSSNSTHPGPAFII